MQLKKVRNAYPEDHGTEVKYAYPFSPLATQFSRPTLGCWYANVGRDAYGPFDTREETVEFLGKRATEHSLDPDPDPLNDAADWLDFGGPE